MAASDSKCAGQFGRSCAAKPDGQSQLYSVSTVVGVSGHCYYCAAADPGSTRRKWWRASGHHSRGVARRNRRHFSGRIVWRLLRRRDWHPHDRRAEFYLAGRYPACFVGGYIGGMVSHRANRKVIRSIVIAVGFAASVYYLWKLYGPAVVRAAAE